MFFATALVIFTLVGALLWLLTRAVWRLCREVLALLILLGKLSK